MPLWRSAIGRGSLRLTRVDVVVDVCFVSVAVLGETDSTAICQLRSQIDAARLSGKLRRRIEAMLLKIQLHWAGHVSRMEDHHLQKVTVWRLSTGHKGAPQKKYEDTLKKSLVTCNIDYRQWTLQASNRTNWRHTVYQATTSFEVKRRANMEDKRKRRKKRDPSEINTGQIVTCSRCGKTCLSRTGFISPQRACTR